MQASGSGLARRADRAGLLVPFRDHVEPALLTVVCGGISAYCPARLSGRIPAGPVHKDCSIPERHGPVEKSCAAISGSGG
ncbi:hypothetical protein MesoLjLb_31490 [Mesorhizobium sp. L-8-3]|nr:hypothetical protein MesoLjLb_31490 [Mesorhizobium sp. L-8-3]